MTTVNVRLTNGEGDPAMGSLWLSPTSRHEDGSIVTTMAEYEVPLNGTALTVIAMTATAPSWAWTVREDLVTGGGIVRTVAVPADLGAPIEYGDLIDVDPKTLSPSAVPEAAWWAALTALGGAPGGAVTLADGYITNVKVNASAGISLDKTADSATRLAMTSAERTKLSTAAGLASPTFTGTPAAPTASGGTNTTQLATTQFVTAAVAAGGAATTAAMVTNTPAGGIAATNVQTAINELDTEKAPKASPVLVTPTATTTPTAGDSSLLLATTAFVATSFVTQASVSAVILLLPLAAAPIGTDGADGDYAVNVNSGRFYGPKASGAWPANPINALEADIQTFAASGTWTLPTWANTVDVICIGPGGGSGAGARVASGTAGAGGGGGGGGGFSRFLFRATDLTSTVAVTVTVGGTGAAAQTTNSTAGAAGTQGSALDTQFGTFLRAARGQSGSGGGIAASAGGGTAGLGASSGGAGAASSGSGLAGTAASSAAGGTGGASGGGVTTVPAGTAGAAGTAPNPWSGNSVAAAGAAGGAGAGGAGDDGLVYAAGALGCSGASGGGATLGAGGRGGAGGLGCGAGGGGASLNGFASGAGNNGGAGLCIVVSRA